VEKLFGKGGDYIMKVFHKNLVLFRTMLLRKPERRASTPDIIREFVRCAHMYMDEAYAEVLPKQSFICAASPANFSVWGPQFWIALDEEWREYIGPVPKNGG